MILLAGIATCQSSQFQRSSTDKNQVERFKIFSRNYSKFKPDGVKRNF